MIRYAELTQILVDIIFCPIEHIFWAGKHKLIKINNKIWDNASTWLWIISLQLSLLKYDKKKILNILFFFEHFYCMYVFRSLRKIKFNNYKIHLSEINYNTR